MENRIKGIHHITAIAGNAKTNYDFYTQIMGVRLVKKTVNFDDPKTYHLYYGNEFGTPGTILSFFPWGNLQPGKAGTGQVTVIVYSVAAGSLEFWEQWLTQNQVKHGKISERFGERFIELNDPDGLTFELVEVETDERKGWAIKDIRAENALKGFYNVTITLESAGPTAEVLTNIFGYKLQFTEGNRSRYSTDVVDTANVVDILEMKEKGGIASAGSVHHIAFRVENEAVLMQFWEKIIAAGHHITEKIDRNYFYSLYFKEPGGVLFEIATDNPG
jgi:glyoxalase family protein